MFDSSDDVGDVLGGEFGAGGIVRILGIIMLSIVAADLFKSKSNLDSNVDKMNNNFAAINKCADEYTYVEDYAPQLNAINDLLRELTIWFYISIGVFAVDILSCCAVCGCYQYHENKENRPVKRNEKIDPEERFLNR